MVSTWTRLALLGLVATLGVATAVKQQQQSAANPIRVVRDPVTGEPAPYVHIRAGLEALIDRKSFYRLIDLGTHKDIEDQKFIDKFT